MERKPIRHYIEKIFLNKQTKEEEDLVDQHFLESFDSERWDENKWGFREETERRIMRGVYRDVHRSKVYFLKQIWLYAAAVAAVILLSLWLWQYPNDGGQRQVKRTAYLSPGKDIALLELGDGTQLDLNNLKEGEKYEKSGFVVLKNQNGDLEYTYENTENTFQSKKNTLKTPVGGRYSIVLADGTKVWLNAGSSLVFPSNFATDQRMVEASGEVYFEVAKDKARPFIVRSKGFDVRVLGTVFNLSAYEDKWAKEPSVALVEGSVEIIVGHVKSMLKPGHKAVVGSEGVTVKTFDVESEIAWKDNYFIFKNRNIKDIMGRIARWYDAEIIYAGDGWDQKNYTVKMSRHQNIEEVLSILELTKSVKFKMEERRITVYNISK